MSKIENQKKENQRRFDKIERFREKTRDKISSQERKFIEEGVKKAWQDYGDTFKALSEID
jgi:hypothetical protein